MRGKLMIGVAGGLALVLLMESRRTWAQDDDKPPTRKELVGRLEDKDFRVRQQALNDLGHLEHSAKEIVPHIIRHLKDPHIRKLSLDKVRVQKGQIDTLRFHMEVPHEGWGFELQKKGKWWLPCNFRMETIQ